MERLTSRYPSGLIAVPQGMVPEALERLAAYEDTGMEPEEISDAVGWMSPVCIGCDGKTPEGARTDKCGYLAGEIHKCMERSKHLAELAQAKQEGRLVVPPVKPGDTVHVDARTLPYNYLHPADGCRDFARCEVVSIVTTGAGTYLKLRALYPSRAGRRDYLRYIVGAIGKTVFLTREEAEAALKEGST